MTMDNGEGRPLDELESGQQDPQDWYFDLPSDAWRRQEEKNRMLRERLRSGAEEDSRTNPFVLRKPAPEPKKRGGLFGLGRKRREEADEDGRTRRLPLFDGEDEEEWSTERPVVAPSDEPRILLRPRGREEERDPGKGPGGGSQAGGPERQGPAAQAGDHLQGRARAEDEREFSAAEPPPRRLRPRREESGERRLNWDFGPGAWPGPEEAAREPDIDNPEDEASIFAKMQQWAERGREAQHRKFGFAEEERAGDAASPGTWDAGPGPAQASGPEERSAEAADSATAAEAADESAGFAASGPRLAPRRREEDAGEARRSSKWDEFFGLNREEGEEDGVGGLSEGLAAMREWAKKKPLGEDIREIPEEFLKPFDWELEEQESTPAAEATAADDPFAQFKVEQAQEPPAWQAEPAGEPGDGDPFAQFRVEQAQEPPAWQAEPAGEPGDGDPFAQFRVEQAQEPAAWQAEPAGEPGDGDPFAQFRVEQAQEPPAWQAEPAGEPGEEDPFAQFRVEQAQEPAGVADDDDPLAGIFAVAPEDRRRDSDEGDRPRKGLFGRLFGRKKQEFSEVAEAPGGSDFAGDASPGGPGDSWWSAAGEDDSRAAWTAADSREGRSERPMGWTAESEEAGRVAPSGEAEESTPEDAWEPEPVEPALSAGRAAAVQDAVTGMDAGAGGLVDDGEDEWSPEPVPPAEEVSFGAAVQAALWASDAPEQEAPAAAWWQAEEPDDAVTPVEPAAEQEAPAAAWWSAEQPERAVTPVEPAPEQEAPAAAWWQAEEPEDAVTPVEPAAEQEAPAAVWWSAGEPAEPVVNEAEAKDETPAAAWWQAEEPERAVTPVEPAAEQEAPAAAWWSAEQPERAVTPVEPAPEQEAPAAAWWQAEEPDDAVTPVEPAAEQEAPAAAWWQAEESAEPVVDEAEAKYVAPVAAVWWQAEEPERAVTPVEPAPEQETPAAAWWSAEEPEDAVTPVEPAAEQEAPAAAWWSPGEPAEPVVNEAEAKDETPAAAWWSAEESAEPVVNEAEAKDETPAAAWWQAEEPDDAVTPVEPAAEQEAPAAAWWSAGEPAERAEPATDAVETKGEEPGNDDPWAALDAGTAPWSRHEANDDRELVPGGSAEHDDMWGAIAEQTEFAVRAPGAETEEVDLAASLEAQMGEAAATSWGGPGGVWAEDEPGSLVSTEDEGDVVLRAFEAHAATPEADPAEEDRRRRETEQALAALFGDEAASIVEAGSEEPEVRPFIRMAAWAPQRSASDDSWAPEEEVRAELERPAGVPVFGFDAPDLVPPWTTDESGRAEEAAAERHEGTRLKSWVRELVETAMLAFLVFLSVRASFQNFKVDGNSMYPTLEDGQFLIVNKLVYSEVNLEKLSQFLPFIEADDDPTRYVFHGPERGDIVVLRDPRDPSTDLIKRVIGLPGETIEIVNGRVYINDRLLEEPYITAPWNDSLPKILIPPDEYFVMGDNRNNSLDSRSAQVGLVSKDLIIGKATLSYLPLDRFGWAPNQQGQLTDQKPVLTTKRLGDE